MNTPVTGTATFGRINSDGGELFAVTAGIPAKDALGKIGCYVEAALSVANVLGMAEDADTSVWAVIYLLETIQAGIWAVVDGLPREPAKAQGDTA
jgi:hypothetical protein